MPLKLLVAVTLTVMCVVSLQSVDASSLRRSSSPLDDVTGDDVTRSRDKRSAAASKYVAPVALSVPVMTGRSSVAATDTWGPPNDNDDEPSRLDTLLLDALLLDYTRHHRPEGGHQRSSHGWAAPYSQLDDEDLMRTIQEAEDKVLAKARAPMKKSGGGHLRSPRELHPVYLGLGQNAASAALNTYASLLADEKRRESLEQQQQGSANPVRFIGKRR